MCAFASQIRFFFWKKINFRLLNVLLGFIFGHHNDRHCLNVSSPLTTPSHALMDKGGDSQQFKTNALSLKTVTLSNHIMGCLVLVVGEQWFKTGVPRHKTAVARNRGTRMGLHTIGQVWKASPSFVRHKFDCNVISLEKLEARP